MLISRHIVSFILIPLSKFEYKYIAQMKNDNEMEWMDTFSIVMKHTIIRYQKTKKHMWTEL